MCGGGLAATGGSGTELDASSSQLLLESLDDAAVHLTDAALAQVQRRSDLFHRQFFIIVEDDDQALISVQAFGDQSHQVIFLDSSGRIFPFLILQDVDWSPKDCNRDGS